MAESNNRRLSDKVAIITGAGSGIGRATAILFTQLGAKVALVDFKEGDLKQTEEQCKPMAKENQRLLPIVADVTKEDDNTRIVDATIDHFGKLDILVNIAGIGEFGTIETTSMEQYDRVMNTNIRAVYHLTMLAVPHLIKTKGNIVNTSSTCASRAFPNLLAYNVSKAAVEHFTKCVAIELGPKHIRANSVSPGSINTNFQSTQLGMTQEEITELREAGKKTHALGRTGEASEVAETIAFLASDAASFVTGSNIPVDGGRQAMSPMEDVLGSCE